jgi:predicted cupin superfamily sugar epimerase
MNADLAARTDAGIIAAAQQEGFMQAEAIIAHLNLAPHPEGGWYRQTWAGPQIGGRACGTAIYFLLK